MATGWTRGGEVMIGGDEAGAGVGIGTDIGIDTGIEMGIEVERDMGIKEKGVVEQGVEKEESTAQQGSEVKIAEAELQIPLVKVEERKVSQWTRRTLIREMMTICQLKRRMIS